MTIVTKKGDQGKTRLLGGFQVPKSHLAIAAVGDLDELSAILGLIRSFEKNNSRNNWILQIQTNLIYLSAEASSTANDSGKLKTKIVSDDLVFLETLICALEQGQPPLTTWVFPGENRLEAWYNLGRCVCRRSERALVCLNLITPFSNPFILPYINRLSDLLWLAGLTAKKNKENS